MAATRYYYSDTISDFLERNTDEIIGKLTLSSQHDINDETSQSWVEEIMTLRNALAPYAGHGSVYFEYNIPRMGRRADVIAIIDGVVFVLEYKSKHSVNHVFLSPTSIINFTSKKQSYDDTRRSSRDNELLQRAQSDL